MSKKADYVAAVQELATVLAKAGPQFNYLFETFFDRGYNVGGTDTLVTADIPAELGIAEADIYAFITLAEQMGNFLAGNAVFQSDYGHTLNRLRMDI